MGLYNIEWSQRIATKAMTAMNNCKLYKNPSLPVPQDMKLVAKYIEKEQEITIKHIGIVICHQLYACYFFINNKVVCYVMLVLCFRFVVTKEFYRSVVFSYIICSSHISQFVPRFLQGLKHKLMPLNMSPP